MGLVLGGWGWAGIVWARGGLVLGWRWVWGCKWDWTGLSWGVVGWVRVGWEWVGSEWG